MSTQEILKQFDQEIRDKEKNDQNFWERKFANHPNFKSQNLPPSVPLLSF
jgi:hypothetical protein